MIRLVLALVVLVLAFMLVGGILAVRAHAVGELGCDASFTVPGDGTMPDPVCQRPAGHAGQHCCSFGGEGVVWGDDGAAYIVQRVGS